MKKFLALTTAAMLAFSAMSMTAFAADGVTLVVNGATVDFAGDQGPVIQNGRTLVPFRAAFEKMGADVNWYDDIHLCEAKYGDTTVSIEINSTKVKLGDGAEIESDVPAQIINGRTMVPLRVLSESIGAEVKWDNATRTVTVNTPTVTGEAPESVQYVSVSGTVKGTVSTVTYNYPVVTDNYTAAAVLNKNIIEDIKAVATDIANNNGTGEDEIEINYTLKYNEGGIFSILYLIGGESVSWGHYGIINGARISDEEYGVVVGDSYDETPLTDDEADEIKDEEISNGTYSCTIKEYTTCEENSEGYVYIRGTVYYPEFTGGDEEVIKALNYQLEKSALKGADSFIASYKDEAAKNFDKNGKNAFDYSYDYMEICDVEIGFDNIAVITNDLSEAVEGKDVRNNTSVLKVDLTTGAVLE
jgi:hypothetical protein